jgi:uncharacterized membrane protein HdeD (DUF308 family)
MKNAAWYGNKEHKWEGYSSTMLVIGSLMAIAGFYFNSIWIFYIVAGWMIITTVIHLVARIFHRMEKIAYKGTWR